MNFSRHTRGLTLCLLLIWPALSVAQVIAQLNEQAVGNTFEDIRWGSSSTQFVGDRFVAFDGEEQTGLYDGLWLKDVTTPRGVIQKLGFQPQVSWAISPDMRYVAFVSDARDLVPPTSNLCWRSVGLNTEALRPCNNLYIHDLQTGSVTRIHGPEGQEIAAESGIGRFSADGRWMAFQRSLSNNPGFHPSQVLLHDRTLGITTLVSGSLHAHTTTVSRDGTRVAFIGFFDAGTSMSRPEMMVYHRESGATERADVDLPAGMTFRVSSVILSANGRYVAFQASCNACPVISNPRVLIRDLVWKRTFQAGRAFDGSDPASGVDVQGISTDGRFLLLESASRDLVENDPSFGDVFVLDRITNAMVRVSQNLNGMQPNGASFSSSMDSRGRYVAFASQARNLVPHAVSPISNPLFLASLDLDNDGMHDSWERFFDGSPLLTGPEFDDDGDGVTNLQEFARGTHPRGRFGASIQIMQEPPDWGLKLHNQTSRPATAVVRFIDQAGNAASRAFRVAALSSLPIRSGDIPDRPPVPFTAEIESDEPLFGLSRR